jgi:hypothetical protein
MLGEVIIPEERGKTIGLRVIPGEPGGVNRVEQTFQSAGVLLGVPFANLGTITVTMTASGAQMAEGRGVAVTDDGGMITWSFSGVGKPTGPNGASSIRGQVLFQSAPPKLARLTGLSGVVEAETDSSQNFMARMWEWK